MSVTKVEDLINPQVMADMVNAELEKKLRATNFYRVDRTLEGRAGDTITVPTWKYIGPAETVPENEQGPVTKMETKDVSYTVKKAVKNVSLTDEAVLSGYGDPLGEAARQLRMSIQDKMDNDGIELLQAINNTNGLVLTLSSGAVTYSDIIDALHMLERDNEEQGIECFLLANHETVKTMRKSPEFLDVGGALRDRTLTTGAVGTLAGAQIIISNKLTKNEAYLLTPNCLTAFMKRDINIEHERQMLYKRTIIGSDCHYVIAIEYYDKLVALRWKP